MSEHHFAGVGEAAYRNLYTWAGPGKPHFCGTDGLPLPAKDRTETGALGYFMVTDAKTGMCMWVLPGQMVAWDGTPDPVRVALQQAVAALREAGKALGLAV